MGVTFFLGRCVFGADKFIPFDEAMNQYMESYKIVGGALAVLKQGKLMYSKGYGFEDRDKKNPVSSMSLFRIGSLTKSITAMAILKLIEQKAFTLDTPAFKYLSLPVTDRRAEKITIRHLLQHTAGWDKEKKPDPMFDSINIAHSIGVKSPAQSKDIIQYVLSKKLDFDPGSKESYSNFGYCVLGRIIEKATKMPYERYLLTLFRSIGIKEMRLGRSLEKYRAPHEVSYYLLSNRKLRNIVSVKPVEVPEPYGSFYLEALDSCGGWIASVKDVALFLSAYEKEWSLKPELRHTMLSSGSEKTKDFFYGLGWFVRPIQGTKVNMWHIGILPGTFALMVRRWDGLSWVVLFNTSSETGTEPYTKIDELLHEAAAKMNHR